MVKELRLCLYHPYSDLGGFKVFKVGERVKWMSPLDEDYSYGTIVDLRRSTAIVEGSGYYKGHLSVVRIKDIEKLEKGGGGFGSHKKHSKQSINKHKLQRS